jgi:FtsP/CotA-like multicopper oxidase with cupredoxin domain
MRVACPIPVTRRQLLTGCAVTAFGIAAPAVLRRGAARAAEMAAKGRPLPGLAVLDATRSNAFSLAAVAGETEFAPGVPSPTLGFNQPYLGPLVKVTTGATVTASVENRTGRPVSAHWHGLLVRGELDGGPHQPIAPGAFWRPTLPIAQGPATLWFHTHIHGETGAQVYAGLAGLLLVTDGRDGERGLPAATGVDDLVLVLQDKRLDGDGRLVYAPGAAERMHGFLGNETFVNGVPLPTAKVPAGVVRLRLLNAANARNFDLSFADGRSFLLIATDQGLLAAPPTLDRLRLTPGERVEILVDFGEHGATRLVSLPHAETRGTMSGGMMHDMLPVPEVFTAPIPLVDFAVDADLPAAVRTLPAALDGDTATPPAPAVTRQFVLNDMGAMMGGGMMMGDGMAGGDGLVFAINGQPFDMGRLDLQVAAGTTERWIVSGQMMGHPFHVHGARFLVESENGAPPRPESRGWKDTVFVEGEAALLVRFDHQAAAAAPFMFHCHILEHEDAGMMGQLAVA